MKRIHISLLSLSVCLLLYSCDPQYSIQYSIHNETDDRIYLYFRYDTVWDTLYMSSQTELYVMGDGGIGNVENELKKADLGFIDQLVIRNINGVEFSRNASDIETWEKNYPGRGEYATVELFITNEDFQ